LVADRTAYEPGEAVRLGAVMDIEAHWHTNSHQPTFDYLIPTELTLELPEGWAEAEVTYPPGSMKSFAFTDGPISVYDGRVVFELRTQVPEGTEIPEGGSGATIAVSLRYQACDDSSCLPPVTTRKSLEIPLGTSGRAAHPEIFEAGSAGAAAATGPAPASLWLMLVLGLVGGLILNVMPCVLPVLSLKVFGLVRSAGEGRREVIKGSLATAAGILLSFWALGGAAALAQTAGSQVGWGTQFQYPGFVTFLALVVVLFCLNLWGLFEISLPQSLGQVAGAGSREGVAGHFASGLFATLMATPCTAPFLGTAVGFALSQPVSTILAMFTAIGLGMSIPYLVLAAAPGAARLFPKPGAWMDHLRKAMGFLLAAAAIWLFYILAAQVSAERLAGIQLGLLGLAFFVWLRARVTQGAMVKGLATVGVLAVAAATVVMSLGAAGSAQGSRPGSDGGRLDWVAFDRQEAEALASDGRLVFVDVTADWCITCKTNERVVLETDEVAGAFAEHQVVAMKADWTNRNEAIGNFLAEYGKAGVPFFVLFRPGAEPHVFSELLTKSSLLSVVEASSRQARQETDGDGSQVASLEE
jgi:suppressor for copper-sensitivity B